MSTGLSLVNFDAQDVDRLVDEAGIEAIICLQSGACFEAMGMFIAFD